MFVINKRRFSLILICFILGILVCSYNDNKVNEKTNASIETTSTPVSGKVIILDAGHRNSRWRCSK